MDGTAAHELTVMARAHAADRQLLASVRTPSSDPGQVVASLLRAQEAHAALRSAGGGYEEAPPSPAAGAAQKPSTGGVS